MPKAKSAKKSTQLRHDPLADKLIDEKYKAEFATEKKKKKKSGSKGKKDVDSDHESVGEAGEEGDADEEMRASMAEEEDEGMNGTSSKKKSLKKVASKSSKDADDSDDDFEDDVIEEEGDEDDDVEYDDNGFIDANLTESEENVVNRFLKAGKAETRTLADIIMDKLREKEEEKGANEAEDTTVFQNTINPKIMEVYGAVGDMLAHYRSGKLPKAVKMLPHIKNWEELLWITRPDMWSPHGTYMLTRVFVSNLNDKLAQRFLNLVLLEKCREDIRVNNKLNYHLYMALKKALFKPGAFYKGILLPLAQSGTCTLREATIIGSVLAKVSIPGTHSAAALLRLIDMPYSGSTSLFIKTLLNKKYSFPMRVIDSLVEHFMSFESETRVLPVIWHQSLLVFAQRYNHVLDNDQCELLKGLVRTHNHHQITMEVRRYLGVKQSGMLIDR